MNNFEELQNYVNEREIKSNAKIIETSKQEIKKENLYNFKGVIILKDIALLETEIDKIHIEIGKNGKFINVQG